VPVQASVFSTGTWKPVTAPLAAGNADSASFARDGRTLATGTTAGGVQLWNVPTGQAIGAPLPGLRDVFVTPIFTPDATHVIAAYAAGRATLWDVRPTTLIQRACAVAGRRLTRAEWEVFLPGSAYNPAC
jgi:hypothetical protein